MYFNVNSTLQRMEDLVLEIQSCGDGNTAYGRIPGFQLRLNNMLISVQHLYHNRNSIVSHVSNSTTLDFQHQVFHSL